MHPTRKLIRLIIALCLLSTLFVGCSKNDSAPQSQPVQMGNPLMEMASLEEMEDKLGYSVPVLEKAVEAYIVVNMGDQPSIGRICYADGSVFNMQRGTGDVSGIYGGESVGEEDVNGIAVSYFTFEDESYALWESDGYTYSLTGGENLNEEVAFLLNS